jgi:hypothetical protein
MPAFRRNDPGHSELFFATLTEDWCYGCADDGDPANHSLCPLRHSHACHHTNAIPAGGQLE